MTATDTYRYLISRLLPVKGDREARACADLMMEHYAGIDRLKRAVHPDAEISESVMRQLDKALTRMEANEPLQYVTGEAWFHGLKLKVTPAVLIPRPETSELVDLIEKQCSDHQDLRVLDVCTGSGCIAVSLARSLPFSRVTALDISDDALAVARDNADSLKVKVDFLKADALALPAPDSAKYDIVVSNPPYVTERERAQIAPSVLDYEPGLALFVPDRDPLLFYRAIGEYAFKALEPGGHLYFEINPDYAGDLSAMLSRQGWQDVNIIRDVHGRNRFAVAVRP